MVDIVTYNIISADSHIAEPPDIFETRLPAALRDRAPKLVTRAGASEWQVDGVEPIPLPWNLATGSGWHRSSRGSQHRGAIAWDDVLPALHDPAERIKAQRTDSVDAEILYPTPSLWDAIRLLDDEELKNGLIRAYNDWIAEFCSSHPNRLFGLAKLPTTSVDDANAELLRCVNDLGLHGAMLDAYPSGAGAGGNPDDDPFWATVNELQVPVSLHYGIGDRASTEPPTGIGPGMKPPMADAIGPMVATGVFDRFPDLKVVFAHGDAGWALHWMEFFDIHYVRHRHLAEYALKDEEAVPSDYLRKHVWFTFHQDRPAVKNRHRLGQAHLMWASHFPCEDSNWPDNRQQSTQVTDEAPTDDRHALLAGNAARLYRLPGFEKGFTEDEITAFDQLVHF